MLWAMHLLCWFNNSGCWLRGDTGLLCTRTGGDTGLFSTTVVVIVSSEITKTNTQQIFIY